MQDNTCVRIVPRVGDEFPFVNVTAIRSDTGCFANLGYFVIPGTPPVLNLGRFPGSSLSCFVSVDLKHAFMKVRIWH